MNSVSEPTISVVLPVYNAERYLSSAINSILNQTFTDFELIIINDGSSDSSCKIINEFAENDSRIRIVNRKNKGLTYSLNEGFALAKGKYIARMDADDISLPLRFEKQFALLEKHNADICGCHFLSIDEKNKKVNSSLVPITDDSILINLALTAPFAHGSVLIRNEFLLKYNLKYGQNGYSSAEDYDLWIQMYKNKAKFCNVDDFLFEYRDYSNSLSKSNTKKLKRDAKKLSSRMFHDYFREIESSLKTMLNVTLSQEEKNLVIGCSLYLLAFGKSTVFFQVIKRMPVKNLIVIGLKFLTGRFFSR